MQTNFNIDSFNKGAQFEQYVQDLIFPDAHYELLHRTSDNNQNFHRYVKKSLEPDFQFKCRLTGKEFYVEAKWRARPYKNRFDVLSENQWKTFPALHSKGKPIYIVFGYGGMASNPDYVHLIPFKDLSSPRIPTIEIAKYQIQKTFYPTSKFQDLSQAHQNIDNENEIKNTNVAEKKVQGSNYKVLGLAAVGLIAILLSIYSFAFSSEETTLKPKEHLQQVIEGYYQDMNGNQVEKLPEYLSSDIDSWYGARDMSTNEILRLAKDHRGTYPYSTSEIDWNSFKVIPQEDGTYLASYNMIYRSKKNIHENYRVYNLHIITTWDRNFKLKSIREIKN